MPSASVIVKLTVPLKSAAGVKVRFEELKVPFAVCPLSNVTVAELKSLLLGTANWTAELSSSTASASGIASTMLTSTFAVAVDPATSAIVYLSTAAVSTSTSGGVYTQTPLPVDVSVTDPPPVVMLTLVTFRVSPTSTSAMLAER